MSQTLRVVTTLVIQDQRAVFCNIFPHSTFPHGLPDGRYALVLQSDVVIPVTDESSGSDCEQVHTMSMYASRDDLERARFEEWVTSPDCPIPAGTPWDDMRVKLAESAWMAALKGQK